MKLWIAEKPSVAEALAKAMGPAKRSKDCWMVGDDVVAWSLGHLFELAPPEHYDSSWRKWKRGDLPLLPEPLETRPLGRHRSHVSLLRKLLRKSTEVVNACDAGREGELIFAWILDSEDAWDKYRERLWLSALSEEEIAKALRSMRSSGDVEPLLWQARARAESDWLLGINATRAATLALSSMGVVSLGRVQTPTLALIVEREEQRKAFQEETFWTVRANFRSSGGDYSGEHEGGRISKDEAQRIKSAVEGKGEVLSVSSREKREAPPLLFDLTALQREASSAWGWSAARTLRVAQALYEEEKVLSYPRTDSRFLPESMKSEDLLRLSPARKQRGDLSRVFSDSKVSDHHAIVPLRQASGMKRERQMLFDLVSRRLGEALSPDAIYWREKIRTVSGGEVFQTTGRRYKEAGWRALGGAESLPRLQQGDRVEVLSCSAAEGKTKPPPRYSDGTLLGAMEAAGRDIDDEEAREAMKDMGLGTPATRAAIIERLIEVDYISREGKALVPSDKGEAVVRALRGSELLRADLTGKWEKELRGIQSAASAKRFQKSLRKWVGENTESLLELEAVENDWGRCPSCQRPLRENRKAISCWRSDDPGCGFALWKKVAGKTLPHSALEGLLRDGRAGPVSGFRSRAGKKFSARLRLQQKGKKWQVVFDEDWAS